MTTVTTTNLYLRLAGGDVRLSDAIIRWHYSSEAVSYYATRYREAMQRGQSAGLVDLWAAQLYAAARQAAHDAHRLERALDARDGNSRGEEIPHD